MMDASNPEPKASPWATRALIAGAVLLLIANAFLAFLSQLREAVDDSEALGWWSYLSARFFGAAFATAIFVGVAIAGARAAGHAKTLASKAKVANWTLVGLLFLNCSMIGRDARSPASTTSRTDVTDAEREGLKVTADSVTHALLGFSFPISGANFTRSPEVERKMMGRVGEHRNIVAWVFRDTAQRQVLIVLVTKLARVNESRFREFAEGFGHAVSKSTPFDSTFAWRDSVGEFGLHIVQPTGLYFAARCLGRMGRLTVVCVETMAADPSALAASRSGLALMR